jgi:UDP-N-acetylglucosamine diphosphorylase / glucose-1-phosphate thymidylyltransferase / UDP-N-acetylgalactosamine diphosphorylase / glucosamine-1-phosphate N-acetyltransferase / galactosamine-1-phosphate N-acetyltransferase
MNINGYISSFSELFPYLSKASPWHIVRDIQQQLSELLTACSSQFIIKGNVAIHKRATVEEKVILKGPMLIDEGCFLGAHAYLRGGVFLGKNVSIGPGCEIKSSIIVGHSALAHFNFLGDSIVGSHVNMEAGSIVANHHNDRPDKTIHVMVDGTIITTDVTKFGALIGDHCKIGANAVLSPGTILVPGTVVNRLQLVQQT